MKSKVQLDDKGNPIEPEPELKILVSAETIEGPQLPRSAKSIWNRVQADNRWIISGQYTETLNAGTTYLAKSDDHDVGDIKKPEHERAHIWIQGVLAGEKTVAAFVLEYELNTSLKTSSWKFISATYGDIVSNPKIMTKKATEFDSWLSVFLPKEKK